MLERDNHLPQTSLIETVWDSVPDFISSLVLLKIRVFDVHDGATSFFFNTVQSPCGVARDCGGCLAGFKMGFLDIDII